MNAVGAGVAAIVVVVMLSGIWMHCMFWMPRLLRSVTWVGVISVSLVNWSEEVTVVLVTPPVLTSYPIS